MEELKAEFPNLLVNSPEKDCSPYILNVVFPGVESHKIVSYLSFNDIYVSAGSACTKGATSHVLKAMHYDESVVGSSIRISLCKYSTKADADALIEALKRYPGGLYAILLSREAAEKQNHRKRNDFRHSLLLHCCSSFLGF